VGLSTVKPPLLYGLGRRNGGRIGLLGGSFNPAHKGHLHISRLALQYLKLDAVWWLVSPQNPLKSTTDMAPFANRFASAKAMARHPRIAPSDLETQLGTRYTIDTLTALQLAMPKTRFVWLMGADNLTQLPRWAKWTNIAARVPIAVWGRPAYSVRAMQGKVAQRYARNRLPLEAAGQLARSQPPAWIFLPIRLHPASATVFRLAGHSATIYGGPQQ
jgi:nicotinate-nucleotide adenylyltransferase